MRLSFPLNRRWFYLLPLFALGVASASAHMHGGTAADEFARGMDAAMAHMDAGMNIPPSGNADRDFAAMMIPHHQAAIDMAVLELRYGKDETLKRLAQEIIVDQQQEIELMRMALGEPLPAETAAPTTPPAAEASGHHHHDTQEH
jgi:hypothetical protein